MFCHKQDYLKIEKINEELLLRNKEVSIHQKHLRILATEVFKSLADMNPDFMKSYLTIKEIP